MTREELLYVALHQATEEGVGIHLATFADICIEWATNEVIDKACEWLLEWETHQGEDIEVVEQFRKAMGSGCSEFPNNCEKGGEE